MEIKGKVGSNTYNKTQQTLKQRLNSETKKDVT